MPFGFHPIWLAIILVIVLIVFGPGKLPELGGALGKGIREFRKASDSLKDEVMNSAPHTETPGTGTVQPTTTPPVETTHTESPAPVATPPADPAKKS